MKRFISVVVLAASLAASTGCGTAWWENVKKDPIAFVTTFIQSVHTFLDTAEAIYQSVHPALPANVAPQVEDKYHHGVMAVTKALNALENGLQAAAEAKQDRPDTQKLVDAVVASVNDLAASLNELRSLSGQPGGGATTNAAFNELHAQQTTVARLAK